MRNSFSKSRYCWFNVSIFSWYSFISCSCFDSSLATSLAKASWNSASLTSSLVSSSFLERKTNENHRHCSPGKRNFKGVSIVVKWSIFPNVNFRCAPHLQTQKLGPGRRNSLSLVVSGGGIRGVSRLLTSQTVLDHSRLWVHLQTLFDWIFYSG